MRYAIVSDIHANLPALSAVLHSLRNEGIDRIICLGDIVGFHTAPGECIDLLRSHNPICLAGNHDDGVTGKLNRRLFPAECWQAIEWTRSTLTGEQREFLLQLPRSLAIDNVGWIMHGMLGNNRRYLVGRGKLLYMSFRLKGARQQIAFHGHTHRPSCYRMYGRIFPVNVDALETSHTQFLSPHAHYVVNPGSVGEPRNGDTRATYLIFDTFAARLEWRRISYDYTSVVRRTLEVFPAHIHGHRQ